MAKLRVDKIAAPIVQDEFTGSVYFDGNGDYLSMPDSTDFTMGTGDYTIEGWFYFNATGTNRLFGQRNSSAGESQLLGEFYDGHTISYYHSIGDTNYVVKKANSISLQTWYHIAITRHNQVLHLYVNGVLQDTNTTTGSLDDRAQPFVIGRQGDFTSNTFNGYISNFRVCKGHAVYTGNFTPPTRELKVHTKPPKGVVFPAADNRTVLLACQDAYNPLTDSSGRHTITGAGHLGGVPGQNLVTNGQFGQNADNWVVSGSISFTRDTTVFSDGGIKITTGGGQSLVTQTLTGLVVGVRYTLSADLYTPSSNPGTDVATISIVNASYNDGSAISTGTNGIIQRKSFAFTASGTSQVIYLSVVRADYATFAPSGSIGYFDNISVIADTPISEANPGLFRKTNITSTITETTGSVFFDGSGDYLDVTESNNDFDFGEDFTIETWIYFNGITSNSWTDFLGSANNTAYLGSSKSGWIAAYYTLDSTGLQFRLSYQSNNAWEFELGWNYTANTGNWYHVAYTRKDGVIDCYINGVKLARSATVGTVGEGATITSSEGFVRVGGGHGSTSRLLNGHLSNVRICKGHAVYKSNFIPPTRELEVHEGPDDDRTVLLACYDGENIFADKSGRHTIAAYGDRLSSPTPTATDSPIGSTTVTPGLTREVDPTAGPTFQGGAGFVSQNWLTLPKGTTTERMPVFGGVQSGTRGIFAGAYSPSRSDLINYVTVPTLGNAIDFGNLSTANGGVAGFSDSTRGWIVGGNTIPAGRINVMEYVTIASSGNAVDGGDLITATQAKPGSVANSIRGIVAGGSTPGQVKTIVHHTIQTTGIAQYFGDLTEAKNQLAGVMSPTRGVFAGGTTPSGKVDTIEYITIASTGNAVLFGELSLDDRCQMGGASNTVRGLFGGGRNPGDFTHIEYITMATLGNGQDFGDLTQTGMDGDVGAVSNSTRVVFGGGASDELGYVEIASLGNTTQFGKFTVQTTANQDPGCFSNGHGGLG